MAAGGEIDGAPGRGGAIRQAMSFPRLVRHTVRSASASFSYGSAVIVCLGLTYLVLPPVSTLMLAPLATLRPVERSVVDLEEISPALPLAVMAAEDARFCQHGGVDWDAIQDVVEAADEDGPARGASTIPMQTAKNLFLWPSRSYIRKGLELPIALFIDLIWPKRRMMENYLNVAEWGEGVFGAEAAARRHFRKSAQDSHPPRGGASGDRPPEPLPPQSFTPERAPSRARGKAACADGSDGALCHLSERVTRQRFWASQRPKASV